MFDGLFGRDPLVWIHFKHLSHDVNLDFIHDPCIARLEGFGPWNIRKTQPIVPRVPVELVLEELRQLPEHFLNHKELINFRVTWKERLAVHKLSHDAAHCPNVDFFAIR